MFRAFSKTTLGVALSAGLAALAHAGPAGAPLTLKEALSYSFVTGIVSAEHADRIAWGRDQEGVRNVWMAQGPAFQPRRVTNFTADDGQELSWLTYSPDGSVLVFVRGGDHDSNWPAEGRLAPNPTASPEEPKMAIWSPALAGAKAIKVADGDAPALS